MTDTAPAPAPAPAKPQLVHQGSYALYRTPAGGLHCVFRRHSYIDDGTGAYVEIPAGEQEDAHLPELPPQLVRIMDEMERTGKRPNPMEVLRLLMGGGMGALNGDGPDAVG